MVDDKNNVEALRIYIFYLLTRESDVEAVISKMDNLFDAMKISEPKNAELYYNLSRLFARYSGRKEEVLKKCM